MTILGVKLLHVPVSLHLCLIPIDTSFRLASERQKMLVNELGSKAVPSMLLGSLDVVVDHVLRLEPLITALIRAGEGTQARVIHQVILETCVCGISRQAASIGAGELGRLSCMKLLMPIEVGNYCKSEPTILAEERALSQMHRIHMRSEIRFPRKRQSTGRALEWLLLEMNCMLMTLQLLLCRESLATVNTRKLLSAVHYSVVTQHIVLMGIHLTTG